MRNFCSTVQAALYAKRKNRRVPVTFALLFFLFSLLFYTDLNLAVGAGFNQNHLADNAGSKLQNTRFAALISLYKKNSQIFLSENTKSNSKNA